MSKLLNESTEQIVWEKEENVNSEPETNNVIPFPHRNLEVHEVTHQKIYVQPDVKPIKIVSSGFGNVRGQLNSVIRSCAA